MSLEAPDNPFLSLERTQDECQALLSSTWARYCLPSVPSPPPGNAAGVRADLRAAARMGSFDTDYRSSGRATGEIAPSARHSHQKSRPDPSLPNAFVMEGSGFDRGPMPRHTHLYLCCIRR